MQSEREQAVRRTTRWALILESCGELLLALTRVVALNLFDLGKSVRVKVKVIIQVIQRRRHALALAGRRAGSCETKQQIRLCSSVL